ncbi:MAG: DUF1905 domain-containing protein [Patescibacteria group bacterium]
MTYKFKAEVWLYPGAVAAWHFVSLPKKLTLNLRKKYKNLHRGWSSLRVKATCGKTAWRTSIFYDKRSESYLLPLKAQIRKKEDIFAGDKVNFQIEIM